MTTLFAHRLPPHGCLVCNRPFNATGTLDQTPPEAGDVSVCIHCAAVAIYDERLQLRPPTDAERQEIDADAEIAAVRRLVLSRPRTKTETLQ